MKTAGKPEGAVAATVGIVVRDPDQAPVPEPEPKAIEGTIPGLAEAFAAYQKLGVDHLIVSPEPMTPRSVERIAEAKQLLSR